jgi:hypothetical protein
MEFHSMAFIFRLVRKREKQRPKPWIWRLAVTAARRLNSPDLVNLGKNLRFGILGDAAAGGETASAAGVFPLLAKGGATTCNGNHPSDFHPT